MSGIPITFAWAGPVHKASALGLTTGSPGELSMWIGDHHDLSPVGAKALTRLLTEKMKGGYRGRERATLRLTRDTAELETRRATRKIDCS